MGSNPTGPTFTTLPLVVIRFASEGLRCFLFRGWGEFLMVRMWIVNFRWLSGGGPGDPIQDSQQGGAGRLQQSQAVRGVAMQTERLRAE